MEEGGFLDLLDEMSLKRFVVDAISRVAVSAEDFDGGARVDPYEPLAQPP